MLRFPNCCLSFVFSAKPFQLFLIFIVCAVCRCCSWHHSSAVCPVWQIQILYSTPLSRGRWFEVLYNCEKPYAVRRLQQSCRSSLIESVWKSECLAPRLLNLDTGWKRLVVPHPGRITPKERALDTRMCGRLSGTRRRTRGSKESKGFLPLSKIEPRISATQPGHHIDFCFAGFSHMVYRPNYWGEWSLVVCESRIFQSVFVVITVSCGYSARTESGKQKPTQVLQMITPMHAEGLEEIPPF